MIEDNPSPKFVLKESSVWKYTIALSTWIESANKSTRLTGGILPEYSVIWTKEYKFSDSLTLPKYNLSLELNWGKDWKSLLLVWGNVAVWIVESLFSISS